MNYEQVLDLFINQAIKLNVLDIDHGIYHCDISKDCETCPVDKLPKPHWCNHDGGYIKRLNDYLKLHHPELYL